MWLFYWYWINNWPWIRWGGVSPGLEPLKLNCTNLHLQTDMIYALNTCALFIRCWNYVTRVAWKLVDLCERVWLLLFPCLFVAKFIFIFILYIHLFIYSGALTFQLINLCISVQNPSDFTFKIELPIDYVEDGVMGNGLDCYTLLSKFDL